MSFQPYQPQSSAQYGRHPDVSPLDASAPPQHKYSQQQHQPRHPNVPTSPRSQRSHPAAHPSSAFNNLQSQRQYGVSASASAPAPAPATQEYGQPPPYAEGANPQSYSRPIQTSRAGNGGPPPPPHRGPVNGNGRQWGPETAGYSNSARRPSFTTPGMDNLGESAPGGGISGIALNVAGANERESGVQALRAIDNWGRSGPDGVGGTGPGPAERYNFTDEGYSPPYGYNERPVPRGLQQQQSSSSSTLPLANAAMAPGQRTSYNNSDRSLPYDAPYPQRYGPDAHGHYVDNPYDRHPNGQAALGVINPMDIADDGDDGISHQEPKRRSMLGMGFPSRNASRDGLTGAAPPAAGAAAAGTAAGAGGFLANLGSRSPSGQYGPVPTGATGGLTVPPPEKSEWLEDEKSRKRKFRWIFGTLAVIIIVGAIVGGVIGGIFAARGDDDGSPGASSDTAEEDDGNGLLAKDSKEIKELMGNPDLHRVFPGVDYTPLNAQYPECLTFEPSQNNITRDVAVLSQLTNTLRLYGTDCNQTEMVLEAIDRLGLTDMKLWLGVWLDGNSTTNDRQLADMNKILDTYGGDPFAGVVVGNEVLFREEMTATELGQVLADVKSTIADKGLDLPLATSDLGDNWTAELASEVDVVMANIHPFFAGVTAEEAAGWTWTFWQNRNIPLTQGVTGKSHVISEVGWPAGGGNNCGPTEVCADDTGGSVAGIDELNQFMEDWVCPSLANGTNFFWFEAFDEPWKVRFNEPGKEWEDKWGLMTVDRELKPGVKIPDCGGKTV